MKRNFYLALAPVVLIFMSTALFAQGGNDRDENNGKYISGTDYAHGHEVVVKRHEDYPEANVVKFSLLSWISGNIPFYYERRVTPWLGLQFGLGLTTRDFVADAVTDIINGLGTNPAANYNNYANYGSQGRKSSVGVYASFQPKFYPRRHALAGFYVSPMVEFKRYNFKAENVDPNAVTDEEQPVYLTNNPLKEYRNAVDFTVNIGRQWLLPNRVSIELMGGVGFRKIWEQRRFITEFNTYNNVTGYNGYSYTSNLTWSNFYRPEFNLSLILGGYF